MSYPKKELAQLVIAHCVAYEIEDVVISPGSRNAPLTIGFTGHPKIKTYSIVDERCAAFFALGIAQQKRKPVCVVCTSGSALLNYYPAVAEAFYSDIPLVIISADRPRHKIDIGDGQTIRQENVFKNHIFFNANLVEHKDYAAANASLINEAILTAIEHNGPVHINVPFEEPLYEMVDTLSVEIIPSEDDKQIAFTDDISKYITTWNTAKRKMILVGSCFPNKELQDQLATLVNDNSVLIFTETTSNLYNDRFINSIDKLIMSLNNDDFKDLKPEILITLGGMVISKKIKHFLRNHQPKHHWHIDKKNELDTYFCLKEHIKTEPVLFFNQFLPAISKVESNYQKNWKQQFKYKKQKHKEYLENSKFTDFKVFDKLLESLPDHIQLQLGNSSIVRYAQLFDINKTITVFCNRGTSGIDGSTSTAIGAATISEKPTVFITGDISFFYDSNALWNTYIPKSFRIVVVNNSGGGIFRFIQGPTETEALDYFETTHNLNASHLCEMFGLEYSSAKDEKELTNQLKDFYYASEKPKLLEIFTPNIDNAIVLRNYFNYLI